MTALDWILHQQEGQFFERKSCFDMQRISISFVLKERLEFKLSINCP